MTTATNNLSAAVQQLIDARLDNIERVLMASGTSRTERQEIIASVENQIMELIARKGDGELERDQMLQILASLDPPEAYMVNDIEAVNANSIRRNQEASLPHQQTLLPQRVQYSSQFKLATSCLCLAAISAILCSSGFGFKLLILVCMSYFTAIAAFVIGLVLLTRFSDRKHAPFTWISIVGIATLPLVFVPSVLLVMIHP